MLTLVIAMLSGLPVTDPADVFRPLVESYYQAELYRGANPSIHAVKVVGERQTRQGPATLVCVNYTMKLRFAGEMTSTESLYFRGGRVVRRSSGNEGLQACTVV